MVDPEVIERNYRAVMANIAAARRGGRDPGEVTLVAVTKTVGAEETRVLYDLGQRHFGESRLQDAIRKMEQLGDLDIRWHMIGHLQRNKVKGVLERFGLLHAVDSARLAEEIERRAGARDERREMFIEVNVTGEAGKYGVAAADLEALLARAAAMPHVRVSGLMTMAPIFAPGEAARPVFRRLRELREAWRGRYPDLRHLSMGMTQDYEVAVEEGADYVRVGAALFAP